MGAGTGVKRQSEKSLFAPFFVLSAIALKFQTKGYCALIEHSAGGMVVYVEAGLQRRTDATDAKPVHAYVATKADRNHET